MKKTKHKPKVFISYSYKDEPFVRILREALQTLSDVVILDPTSETVHGERIVDKISKMLKDSDIVITLLSPESTHSPNVLFELGMAVALDKKVIPIARRNTDISSIPFNIRDRSLIISKGPKSTAKRLARDVFQSIGPTKEFSGR